MLSVAQLGSRIVSDDRREDRARPPGRCAGRTRTTRRGCITGPRCAQVQRACRARCAARGCAGCSGHVAAPSRHRTRERAGRDRALSQQRVSSRPRPPRTTSSGKSSADPASRWPARPPTRRSRTSPRVPAPSEPPRPCTTAEHVPPTSRTSTSRRRSDDWVSWPAHRRRRA